MHLGEWFAHFIDSSSVLRKGGNSDPRGIRYQTMELPADVGAPLIIEDIEQLRYLFETEEPRLVEGLLSIIDSIDLSLMQLSNENNRRFANLMNSFQANNRTGIRVEGNPDPMDQNMNMVVNKKYDGNKRY